MPSGLSIDLIPCLLFLSWALDLFHWSLVLSGVYLPLFFMVCRSTKAPALLLVRIPGRPAARAGPAAASSRHKGGPASCGGRQQSERCSRFGLGAEQGELLEGAGRGTSNGGARAARQAAAHCPRAAGHGNSSCIFACVLVICRRQLLA